MHHQYLRHLTHVDVCRLLCRGALYPKRDARYNPEKRFVTRSEFTMYMDTAGDCTPDPCPDLNDSDTVEDTNTTVEEIRKKFGD